MSSVRDNQGQLIVRTPPPTVNQRLLTQEPDLNPASHIIHQAKPLSRASVSRRNLTITHDALEVAAETGVI